MTAVGALVFTGLSLNAAGEQNNLTAQSQYTDRYIKAIEQLDKAGPEHLQGRLGGIYALERLAHDSPRDQPAVIEVLSAFIRTTGPQQHEEYDQAPLSCRPLKQEVTADIQAALDVLGRRDVAYDNDTRIDLTNTCLLAADLSGANLNEADLSFALLFDADLSGASLVGAELTHANLENASLEHANLQDASLHAAKLNTTNMIESNLVGTDLTWAELNGANLSDARHDSTTITVQVVSSEGTSGAWW